MTENTIFIPWYRWCRLIGQLRERGRGVRESGALLLSPKDSKKVTDVLYYDDLDPRALDTGIVVLDGGAMIKAWEYCNANKLTVVADVHTHPGANTSQSHSDQMNPIVQKKNHTALIIPKYALQNRFSLKGVGIHEYLTNKRWRRCAADERRIRITAF